jgi:hypothetical protein
MKQFLRKSEVEKKTKKNKTKTYNSEDSLVVTHPTTNSPACGLSTAERTGSPVFHTLWSYVLKPTPMCLRSGDLRTGVPHKTRREQKKKKKKKKKVTS